MSIESKYLNRFNTLREKCGPNIYELRDNRILVERLTETEIKTKTGLILNTNTGNQFNSIGADKPLLFMVLDIGEGYASEDGSITRDAMNIDVGDIIILPKLSVKYFSVFMDMAEYVPDTIGIARENDIELRFKQAAGYSCFFGALNS